MKTKFSAYGGAFCRFRAGVLVGLVAIAIGFGGIVHAKPLGQATVTQVNNDVRFKPSTGDERPAKAKDVVKGADTVRTGQKSQAELEFEDRTITRLGSNSTFTFDPDKREFQLKKGLLLFDMPKNAGGGKIITPAGTAAIEGTAGIVSYRSAPKIICLAGVINVQNPNGQLLAKVMPGQLFIVGVTKYPVDFMLNGLKTGKLMKGGLPNNKQEFDNSNNNQQGQIQNGQLQATPFVMLGENNNVVIAQSTSPSDSTSKQGVQGNPNNPGNNPTPPPSPTSSTATLDDNAIINAATKTLTATRTDTTTPQADASLPTQASSSPDPPVTLDADIIPPATLTVSSTETLTGTINTAGRLAFDFGTQDISVTGNPQAVPSGTGAFNIELDTQGTLTFATTTFSVGAAETGPSSMWFSAVGDATVGSSSTGPVNLWLHSGPTDGTNPAGLLHIESTGGKTSLAGVGYDPAADPNDVWRSHVSATVNAGGGIYNGGTVELVSQGQHTYLSDGVTVPLDGVVINNATIDVSAKDDYGYLTSGTGGKVFIGAKSNTDDYTVSGWGKNLQVVIEDSVDIYANGYVPGRVVISSSGNDAVLGRIFMNVPNSTGHITIDAQQVFSGLSGSSSSAGGSINLLGYSPPSSFNIFLATTGPAGGGTILLNAYGLYYSANDWGGGSSGAGGINIQYARLDSSAPYGTSLAAGAISLQAPQISISRSLITAGDYFTTSGEIGQIAITAVNPNGTHLGTQVSLNNHSELSVGGSTVGSYSGILISGDTVSMDETTALYAGAAKVHIVSRENTGSWSTDSSASLYWSPLYFIMNGASTIDVRNTDEHPNPTITGDYNLTGQFADDNVAVFDFGNQNILLWKNGPNSIPSGIMETEFKTTGSFEALDMVPNNYGGGGGGSSDTDHVTIHAAGIQIVNSLFDMSGSSYGPGRLQMYSTTDLMVVSPAEYTETPAPPSTLAPQSGTVNGLNVGGLLHLESAGVTAFGGGDSERITQALAGATDIGGTIEIISTGDGTGAGGTVEGVHIRNAYIDASHQVTRTDYDPYVYVDYSTPAATKGGLITIDGKQQVAVQDSTINADGLKTAGSISLLSEGTSYQPGRIVVAADSSYVFLSAQNLSVTSWSGPGDSGLGILGADFSDGSKSINLVASGEAGGGTIKITAYDMIGIAGTTLDASALLGSDQLGGTISLSSDYAIYLRNDIVKANGATAGNIYLQAPSLISLETFDPSNYLRLSAQDFSAELPATAYGNVDILGAASRASGYESIQMFANGTGGNIEVAALGSWYASASTWYGSSSGLGGINIYNARLDASATVESGDYGGWVSLLAPQITLSHAALVANADGSAVAGIIDVTGRNPNGTHLGTSVSIASSSLDTYGSSAASPINSTLSGIHIEADQVTIDSVNSLHPDQSQVHIASRINTGFTDAGTKWSENPDDPIYWSPLYQVMIDNGVTIDLSSSTPTISGPKLSTITGTWSDSTAIFDLGSQNVLIWPQGPVCIGNAGTFDVDLITSSTFEGQDVTFATPSGSSFSRLTVSASGMQFLNTTFNIGSSGAALGPGQLMLTADSDLVIASQPDASGAAPSTLIVQNGVNGSDQNAGGTISLISSGGQVAFLGYNGSRLTQAYAGATDVGGTVSISGTGSASSDYGHINGIYMRDALIDVSHPFTVSAGTVTLGSTPAAQGGTVMLSGANGVLIQDNTTLCADGTTQAGSLHVEGSAVNLVLASASGDIRLSAQQTGTSGTTAAGDIDILGAFNMEGFDSYNQNIQVIGNNGGSIVVESTGNISIQNTSLNASASYSAEKGGTISLMALGNLSLRNVFLDASEYGGGESIYAGGQILLGTPEPVANGAVIDFGNGNMRIVMNESVDMRADGQGAAGTIRIVSTGDNTHPGSIAMNVGTYTGYIYVSARDSIAMAYPDYGGIDLLGAYASTKSSLKVMATGYAGGGLIRLTAVGDINIQEADINTPVLETLAVPAGQIVMNAGTTLSIQDANIEAIPGAPDNFASTGQNPNASGGSITLRGASSVNLSSVNNWLTIRADGPTSESPKATSAGQINVESPGAISIRTDNTYSYVRLSALDSLEVFDTSSHGGDIDFLGSGLRSLGNESIQIVASDASGVGSIDVESAGAETVYNAAFDVSTPASSTASAGTVTLHATAAVTMNGARVDASSYNTADTHGGTVAIQGDAVTIEGAPYTASGVSHGGSTAITADGTTAGAINVQASSASAGDVNIANDATHYVRLSAQDSATVLNALSTGGNIDIIGASGRSSGSETVQISASGPTGYGNLNIVSVQNLSIINAQLNATGAINLQGQNVLVQNSALTAALISINAYSTASILSSILTAPTINVYAPTVDFNGSTLNGNAQVYANTVTHQPSSGTITLHPYQPKP